MPRPRVLVTHRIPAAGLDRLQAACDLRLWEGATAIPRTRLLAEAKGCDGLLTLLMDRVDEELLDAAGPQLRVVSNYAVGYDNVDLAACVARGVAVGNTPGVLTETTADLAFSLLAAVARRIVEGARHVREGRWVAWQPMLMLGADMHGATLGIVGFGRIGQALARRAAGFGMRVLYWSRTRLDQDREAQLGVTWAELPDLLAAADFVSLHVSLSPETRHLIDAAALGRMKRTAILVNTARGPVVDQAALTIALQRGTIAGAALDVTDPEPIALDDPLLRLDNCLIVPHIGSASVATRARMAEMAAANLLAGVNGEPLPTPVVPD